MIITLQFKTNDVLDQIDDDSLENLSKEDRKWIESHIQYGENLTVDFNIAIQKQ